MNDEELISLFFDRSENAVSETERQYKRYIHTIAFNVLGSFEDAEECVNDALLAVWNKIPPEHPNNFKAYIAKVTKNLALHKSESKNAQKRDQSNDVPLDEFAECFPDDAAEVSDKIAVKNALNGFLRSLGKRDRMIFMQRYFYCCSVAEIAKKNHLTENNVKVILCRTRTQLKEHLKKEDMINE